MKRSVFKAFIKKYIKLLFTMLLVSSLGCGLMTGMGNGFLSLKTTLDDYLNEMRYPDGVVETTVMTRDALNKTAAVEGVQVTNARLSGNLMLLGNKGVYYTMLARTYSDEEFQGIYYWEKSDKEAEYPLLIERKFSKINNIHAGDSLEIRFEDRSWNGMVTGVVSRPEMLGSHQIGDIQLQSTDIGYLYIKDDTMDKITNPDYEAASAEWEKNNEEYTQKKEEAEGDYNKIIGDIDEAEKTLQSKKAELEEQIKTAGSKKAELLKYRDQIEEKRKELKKKEAELREKKSELNDAEEKLEKAKKDIVSGKKEIKKQKKSLASKKKSLKKEKKKLNSQLKDLDAKEKELKSKKASAQKAKDEIEKKLKEVEDKEKPLREKKEEAQSNLSLLQDLRDSVDTLKKDFSSFSDFVRKSPDESDVDKWASKAQNKMEELVSDISRVIKVTNRAEDGQDILKLLRSSGITNDKLENVIDELEKYSDAMDDHQKEFLRLMDEGGESEKLESLRDEVIKDSKEALELFTKDNKFTNDDYEELLGKADDVIKELKDGLSQIDDGLKQIEDGKKTILEKEEEVEEGLAQLEDAQQQIKEGRAAIKDGLKEIDKGLDSIESGYKEIDHYTKEIEKEEKKIPGNEAKIRNYTNEYKKAKQELLKAKNTLLSSEEKVESGLKEIEEKTAEGKKQLKEGQDKITQSRKTAENERIKGLKQFKEIEAELDKAKAELGEWDGYSNFCNEFLLRFDKDTNPDETLARTQLALGEENVKDSYTLANSEVKLEIDLNVDPLGIMSIYVPVLFFLVALIVEFLFMSFLIRQCRREIGILRALGYSRVSIIALFCGINLLTSVASIILGILIGIGLTKYICTFFQGYFDLYFFNHEIYWKQVIIAILSTIVVGQIATIASTSYISRIQPSEAMSRPAPQATGTFGRRLMSHLKLPPFTKYCISSLLRNKMRLLFSMICLASSIVLIFTGISFNFSKDEILIELFEDRTHYDCEIFLKNDPDEEFINRLTASVPVQNLEKVYYYSRDIEANGVKEERLIKAISPDSELISIYDKKKKPLSVSDDGIILERHTAEPMGVSAGDTVCLDGIPTKISAISEEHEKRTQYISSNSIEALGEPDTCSIICNIDPKHQITLMDFLFKEENFIYTAFTSHIYNALKDAFKAFTVAVMIILAFATIIGMMIVINTVSFNLQEQKKDICLLRTLGFQQSDLSIRLLTQTAVYYVFSCIIGIPGGILVTKLILKKLETSDRNYPLVNDYRIYLFTLLLVLAYILASHFISMKSIEKWDLVETVKDKE